MRAGGEETHTCLVAKQSVNVCHVIQTPLLDAAVQAAAVQLVCTFPKRQPSHRILVSRKSLRAGQNKQAAA